VTDKTRRWFADSTIPYALAALRLFEHSRTSKADYVFGPLEVSAMTDDGLAVSGSEAALAQAAEVLSAIPGLVEYAPD
jgi:hypothetical protein